VNLQQVLTNTDPRVFGERLSEVIGASVRLPRQRLASVVLNPGERTAIELLNEVVRQLGTAWRRDFVLRRKGDHTAAIESSDPSHARLPSVGTVEPQIWQRTFARAVHSISDSVACRVELPSALPEGRFTLVSKEPVPAERALTELAQQAGMVVEVVVVIEAAGPEADRERLEEIDRRNYEDLVDKGSLVAWLQNKYGTDLFDQGFPWDDLELNRDAILVTAGGELDLALSDIQRLLGLIQLEAQSAQQSGPVGEAPPDDADPPEQESGSSR